MAHYLPSSGVRRKGPDPRPRAQPCAAPPRARTWPLLCAFWPPPPWMYYLSASITNLLCFKIDEERLEKLPLYQLRLLASPGAGMVFRVPPPCPGGVVVTGRGGAGQGPGVVGQTPAPLGARAGAWPAHGGPRPGYIRVRAGLGGDGETFLFQLQFTCH